VAIGEDVTEQLDVEPAVFFVRRHVYPKYACRACERIVAAPSVPCVPCVIERGRPGPGLLAHVLVSKYADPLPLYRPQQIYQRSGVELARSTLAEWVGAVGVALQPLVAAMKADLVREQAERPRSLRVPQGHRHPPAYASRSPHRGAVAAVLGADDVSIAIAASEGKVGTPDAYVAPDIPDSKPFSVGVPF